MIICEFDESQDAILWLSELRDCFGKDGYNVYTMSNKVECVLYDLEFLPDELCYEAAMEQVNNFLYWQTYYCQSDAILLGLNTSDCSNINIFEMNADIVIKVNDANGATRIKIYCDGKMKLERIFEHINHININILYREILKLFTEDTDE